MTAPARISQQEIDRTFKGVARAGIDRARVVLDLENRKIEVIIGESLAAAGDERGEVWTDED
ncbi:MAG: hypothetical protein MK104_03185 [Erythrobacter sp.]|nr:hypothetical protein [Erythrobacter sp.]